MDNPDESKATGCLYVMATPIGNLEDMTFRAVDILGKVDIIAAEDTRHTAKLLTHYRVKRPLISYHEHNEEKRTPELIKHLQSGRAVALVSSAGTPTVSDPGYRLIRQAIADGIRIIPVPGANAAIAALSVSGLPTDTFIFVGFPPRKKQKRALLLNDLAERERTLIFYESPRRMAGLISEILSVMGNRYAVLSREMTKLHEEFIRGRLTDILDQINDRPALKGECTLLVEGSGKTVEVSTAAIQKQIECRLNVPGTHMSVLTREIASTYHVSKNRVYQEALKLLHQRTKNNG